MPPAGYAGRIDSLDTVDGSRLAGRRIAIDPGHGGFYPGSIGVNGLTEAAVNLGVALELRDLLAARGAQVFLTRDRDRDFLAPADSSLRADLNERSRLANTFAPDVFVSVHHNADAGGAHDVNETQTYYQLGDEGPSLELGADVHRALARNLGIGSGKLLPGNYAVLRNSRAPAILTESSYLTYPPAESLLAHPRALQLEAEALYMGVARYFMRSPPVIDAFELGDAGLVVADSGEVASYPTLMVRVRGAFDAVTLTVDGAPATYERSAQQLNWTPRQALAPGWHDAAVQVRLAGEGASAPRRVRFRVRNTPEQLGADFPRQPAWDGLQPLALRVRLKDRAGQYALDTLAVRVRSRGTVALVPADTVIQLRDGAGWAYFRRAQKKVAAKSQTVQVEVGVAIAAKPAQSRVAGTAPPATAPLSSVRSRIEWAAEPSARTLAHRAGWAVDSSGTPIRNAPGTQGATPSVEWINRDGFVALPIDAESLAAVPQLRGFRRIASDTPWPPRFIAIANGALIGRRITLDPAGGGEDAAGVSPWGTRAAQLNLEVARALRALLEAAGADVAMTRDRNIGLSDIQRVQISEAFRSDRFVRIGHGTHPPRAGYYFSSAPGKRWAQRLAGLVPDFGLPAIVYGEDAQWPIQQTSCVALYASLGRISDPADEERLRAPGTLRAEAWALFASLILEFAPDARTRVDAIEVRGADGGPLAGAAVTLGGALVCETDASGIARFARTEPGGIEADVQDPRLNARTILLDFSRHSLVTGTTDR